MPSTLGASISWQSLQNTKLFQRVFRCPMLNQHIQVSVVQGAVKQDREKVKNLSVFADTLKMPIVMLLSTWHSYQRAFFNCRQTGMSARAILAWLKWQRSESLATTEPLVFRRGSMSAIVVKMKYYYGIFVTTS